MRRALAGIVLALVAGVPGAGAGPGILVRNADRWYKPPLRRVLHPPEALPAFPPEELLLPFRDQDLVDLGAAGYLEGYQGRPWDRVGPCSRYEALFLLGRLLHEISAVYGGVLSAPRTGPPRTLLPEPLAVGDGPRGSRGGWGRDEVAWVLAERLAKPHPSQPAWWVEAPDRIQAAGWVAALLDKLAPKVTVLVDPEPYPSLLKGDFPWYGHPLRKRVKRVVEARLMPVTDGRFRPRDELGAREWLRIVSRLRFVIHGYQAKPVLARPHAG